MNYTTFADECKSRLKQIAKTSDHKLVPGDNSDEDIPNNVDYFLRVLAIWTVEELHVKPKRDNPGIEDMDTATANIVAGK